MTNDEEPSLLFYYFLTPEILQVTSCNVLTNVDPRTATEQDCIRVERDTSQQDVTNYAMTIL